MTDDGQPVTGLGAADFIVTVAGRSRRVVSAAYVGAGASVGGTPGTPVIPLPISSNDGLRGGRLVLFVVDQNTLVQSDVRQAADCGRAAVRALDAGRSERARR